MSSENRFSVILGCIKSVCPFALLTALLLGLFSLVYFLYGLPTEGILDSWFLCLLLLVFVLPFYFWHYLQKHWQYQRIRKNLPLLMEQLPSPDTLHEADLVCIAKELKHILDVSGTVQDTRDQEMLDYYTTWVHQIKTPIAAMKLMLENEDSDENSRLLAELFRIEQYADSALSYLRLDHTSDYVFRTYSLDSILKQAIHKYAPLFVQSRVRLVYDSTPISVLTDEKWLLLILEQILSNSVKYTPPGGTVTITVTPEKVLCIADTGIGIAPEDLPRIFEKGFTGYNGRTDKKATGLGLYLCRRAAEKLSVRLWAESTPGQGTALFLDLASAPLGVE